MKTVRLVVLRPRWLWQRLGVFFCSYATETDRENHAHAVEAGWRVAREKLSRVALYAASQGERDQAAWILGEADAAYREVIDQWEG